LTRAGRDQ